MRVFVLSPGRSGSLTFAKACEHLTNYTSSHESRARAMLGEARFDYPDNHIESDNRLAWFLGGLGERFDSTEVLYVHLTREPEATAKSFLGRWDSQWQGSIIKAFAHGLLMSSTEWEVGRRLDVCRFYVETVHSNILEFVRSRPSITMDLESPKLKFGEFLERIGAEGDLRAAMEEWDIRHNAS